VEAFGVRIQQSLWIRLCGTRKFHFIVSSTQGAILVCGLRETELP